MSVKMATLIIVATISISGCATTQYKWVDISGQGRDEGAFEMSKASCQQQAMNAGNVQEQQNSSEHCYTPACFMVQGAQVILSEELALNECMQSLGWKKVPVNN